MNLTLDQAYEVMENTIIGNITHPHYARVTDLAKLYKQLITGNNIDSLFHQFVRREDQSLFEQRKRLTQIITPAVSSSIKTPFFKVGRVNNIIKKLELKEEKTDGKTRLETAISRYNGTKSLDYYMRQRFTNLSFSDPNAFIVTEFDPVELGPNGEMTEPVKPRPFVVSSTNAINYKFDNGILKYLVVRLPLVYKSKKGEDCQGFSYTIYFPEYAIKYTQVDSDRFPSVRPREYAEFQNGEGGLFEIFRADESRVFVVEEYNHKSRLIPAVRVGYKEDEVTDGDTCVNPMHDGMPYFMKSIKTVSEFDLTMCLHAFPQKFQYVNRCQGESPELGCSGGQTISGGTCKKCNGTGISVHASAQDAVVMRMPQDKDDMMDLEQMVHYEYPPIELLKFQNEYILQLKNEVRQAVFNSEIFDKTEVAATATELKISLDSVYDTLFPFAEHFSEVYKHIVKTSAYYLDIQDVEVIHQFPKDFKFKSLSDLLGELKLSGDSDAPGYVRRELANDIAEQQFIDKPEELKRIRIKERFYPFPDKTETEIVYIISNGKTTLYNEVLWANFDSIFNELEETNPELYTLATAKQKELVKAKVDALILEIKGQQAAPAIGFTGAADEEGELTNESGGGNIETPVDVEAEAKAKLKGSVGGVQGILEIQSSVAAGTTDYSAAITLLYEIFGFEESVAKKLLGTPKKIKPNDTYPNSKA